MQGYLLSDVYIGWPGRVHVPRDLATIDIYCRGDEETLFRNRTLQIEAHWTRNSSCSAWVAGMSDEAVVTEAMILSLIKG